MIPCLDHEPRLCGKGAVSASAQLRPSESLVGLLYSHVLPSPLPATMVSRRTRSCFVVSDSNRQKFGYVYFEDELEECAHLFLEKHNHARKHHAAAS